MVKPLALRFPAASVAGLVLTLGFPFLFLLVPSMAHQTLSNQRQDLWVVVSEWAATIALAAIVVFWERLPFAASIGLRKPRWFDALATVLAIFATMLTAGIVAAVFHLSSAQLSSVNPAAIQALPFALRLAMTLTAGFCEEVLLRGYALERLASLTGSIWIGVPIVITVFTLGHVVRYGVSLQLIGVAIIGTFLTLLYAWRRNLWPCIAMHWIIDGVGLLLAPSFAHPA